MRSQVFISHSSSAEDAALITALEAGCNSAGLIPYLAGREFAPSTVTEKLRAAILASDFLVAILTPASVGSPWVNQELAVALELGKPIIPLLEADTPAPGFISERDQIRFAREQFGTAVMRAVDFIVKRKAETDPVFRVQATVSEDGRMRAATLSVLEAVHVHGAAHQLTRAEALAFLNGEHPCPEREAQFFLRATFELDGKRRLIWLQVRDLHAAGVKVGDDLYMWPHVLLPVPEAPVRRSTEPAAPFEPPTSMSDRADSGEPRIIVETTRDLADLHGRRIPSGARGLFVWFPETTPWGEETVQVRIGEKTEVLPLDSVVAVGPPDHADIWNRLRRRILER